MKSKYIIILAVICTVLGAFMYRSLFKCEHNVILETDTVYVEVVSYDTIIQEKPVPYKITEVLTVNDTAYLYYPVDTAAILADYYRTRYYADTLKNDKDGFVYLTESVSQNALFDRKLYFESRCTDKIITNTVYRHGFYYSGAILSDLNNFGDSLGISYQNKQGRLYGAGIGYYAQRYFYINISVPF